MDNEDKKKFEMNEDKWEIKEMEKEFEEERIEKKEMKWEREKNLKVDIMSEKGKIGMGGI